MKNNMKGKFKDLAILTVVVVAIQLLLSQFVYPLIPGVGVTQNVYSITPQTALTSPTVGNKILGVLTGILPFNLGNLTHWVVLFLGAFLMLFAGYWAVGQRWVPWKGTSAYSRLFAILLYGTAVLWVVLVVMKMSNFSTIALPLLIGLALNYILVASAVVGIAKTKLGKFVRI